MTLKKIHSLEFHIQLQMLQIMLNSSLMISFVLDIIIYLMVIHYLLEGLNITFLGEAVLEQCIYLIGQNKTTLTGSN